MWRARQYLSVRKLKVLEVRFFCYFASFVFCLDPGLQKRRISWYQPVRFIHWCTKLLSFKVSQTWNTTCLVSREQHFRTNQKPSKPLFYRKGCKKNDNQLFWSHRKLNEKKTNILFFAVTDSKFYKNVFLKKMCKFLPEHFVCFWKTSRQVILSPNCVVTWWCSLKIKKFENIRIKTRSIFTLTFALCKNQENQSTLSQMHCQQKLTAWKWMN